MLDLPFRGGWRVENSPARRVPGHGTEAFGSSHAIDVVAVDPGGRSAPRTWPGLAVAEPPELFRGFGAPILAPRGGSRQVRLLCCSRDHHVRTEEGAPSDARSP